jgi:rubrerythrin
VSEASPTDAPEVLEASRAREKAQALFYRTLAAAALEIADAVERLNDLHADEQHHLSRLTARLLELGHRPRDLSALTAPGAVLEGWEIAAREREASEVRWYESMVELDLDADTLALLQEILDSERHHLQELRGKWMSA